MAESSYNGEGAFGHRGNKRRTTADKAGGDPGLDHLGRFAAVRDGEELERSVAGKRN